MNSFTAAFFAIVIKCALCASNVGSTPFVIENISMTSTVPPSIDDLIVLKWKHAESTVKQFAALVVKNILPHAVRASEEMNLTPACSRDLMKFLIGVKQMKVWAFRMLDASGKIPNGMFSGSINALGDYDVCVETEVAKSFRGQYCTLNIYPPVPERVPFHSMHEMLPQFANVSRPDTLLHDFISRANYFYHLHFRSSICVPSTCSREEVETIAVKVRQLIGIDFNITVPNCEIKMSGVVFGTIEIVVIVILSSLFLSAVIATITDVVLELRCGAEDQSYKEELNTPLKVLLCFSFYTNVQRLLKKDKSPESIKIFHGMKVITMLWVILNHTYLYTNYQTLSAIELAKEKGKELAFQFITNGFLSVETFYFISGVLISYGVMKAKEQRLNAFLYVFKRIWRLLPSYTLVIACVFLVQHFGSGPAWKETVIDGLTEKCRKYWWTNLLFINNFAVGFSEMCMDWTWYLPVDVQLYVISLIVVIPLKKNPRLAFIMNALFLAVGTALTAIFHVHYKLQPTAIFVYPHPEDIDYFTNNNYYRTYVHCASYCVGLSLGYILATKQKIRIPLALNIFGWTSSFALGLCVVYGVYDWNQGNVPGLFVSTLYACTHKFIWSLALAWVTITCMTGHGGIATKFLTWEAFVPFSRLTYMTYLVHPIIPIVYVGSTRNLIRPEHRTYLFMYLGNIALSFMIACGLHLLCESPFLGLERIIFAPKRRPSKQGLQNHPPYEENCLDKVRCHKIEEKNEISTINIKQIENGI